MAAEFDFEVVLNLEKSKRAEGDGIGLNQDGTMVVVYEVPLGAIDDGREWLQENRKTISGVTIDHNPVEGVWRSVEITTHKNVRDSRGGTITQTFAKGWIKSLVSGSTIDWSEARLVEGSSIKEGGTNGTFPAADTDAASANPQEYHLVRWVGIDPEKIEEVADSLRELSASDWSVEINGEDVGDGFFRLKVMESIDRGDSKKDKSATIDLLLAKPRFNLQTWETYGTPQAATVYNLYSVPSHIAQEIVDVYNKTEGSSCRPGRPDANGLIDLEFTDAPEEDGDTTGISGSSCSYYSTTTYYHNYDAPVDVPENAMGITYRSRFDLVRNTGRYSGFIEKRQRQTIHVASYRSEDTHGHYVEEESWSGLYLISGVYREATLSIAAGAVSVAYETVNLPTPGVLDTGEKVYVSKRDNDDCTLDVVVRTHTMKDAPDIEYDTHDDASRHDHAVETLNVDPATSVTLTAGDNEVLQASVRYDKESGSLDIKELTSESKDLEGRTTEVSAARTTTRTTSTSTDTPPEDAVQTEGQVRRTSYKETPFGERYDASEEVVEAVDQEGSEYRDTHARSSESTSHSQGDELTSPTAAAGTVASRRNSPTEFGKMSTTDEVVTAKDQTGASGDATHAKTSSVQTHTQASAALSSPSAGAGSIERKSSTPTEFGLWATHDETITAHDQTAQSSEDSGSRSSATTLHTQGDQPSTASAGDGTIKRVSASPTEFGKFSSREETITAKDQTASSYADTHARTSSTTTHTQGSEVADESASEGEIINIRNAPTEFNKFSTSREVITAVDQEATDSHQDFSKEINVEKHTQGESLGEASETTGSIIKHRETPTEFGKFATVKETTTAKNQTAQEVISDSSKRVVRDFDTQADAEIGEAKAEAGETRRTLNRETEFGRYATTDETVTPKDQSATSYRETFAQSSSIETHTHSDTLEQPTEVEGEIKVARTTPTEFGEGYSATVEEIVTAKDQTGTVYVDTHAKSTTTDTHTQNENELDEPTAAEGEVVTRRTSPTEFGRWSTVDETVTAKDQEATSSSDDHSKSSSAETHTQADSALGTATAEDGQIVNSRSAPTEFGRFSTAEETITAKDQTATDTEETHARTTTVQKHTQGEELVDAVVIAGQITRATQSPTPFGKFVTREETIETKDQEGASWEVTAARSVTREVHTQNESDLVEPSQTDGEIRRSSNSPTEFGRTQTTEETITATDQEGSSEEQTHARTVERTTHTQNEAEVASPALTTGAINSVVNRPTEFGRTQTTETTVTASEQSTGDFTSRVGVDYIATTDNYTNKETPPALESDTKGTANYKENEFGLYNGSITTLEKRDVSDSYTSRVVSDEGGGRPRTVTTYWHYDSPQPGGDDYVVHRHDDETFTTEQTDWDDVGWFDDDKEEFEWKYKTDYLGVDKKRKITYTRYFKYENTYLNCMSKITGNIVKGSISINRSRYGYWEATYLVVETEGEWEDL
jgi:hypothetical protein